MRGAILLLIIGYFLSSDLVSREASMIVSAISEAIGMSPDMDVAVGGSDKSSACFSAEVQTKVQSSSLNLDVKARDNNTPGGRWFAQNLRLCKQTKRISC